MKIFIDSNIWLRFFLANEEKSFKACQKLFQLIETGRIKPYTSTIVLLEVNYVLVSIYKVASSSVFQDLKNILTTRNLTLIEKADFVKSLDLSQKLKIKLADCLISLQVPKDSFLVTYDKDFKKFKNLKVKTPEELIKD
jgi:predicted nucleic acid-binding protein